MVTINLYVGKLSSMGVRTKHATTQLTNHKCMHYPGMCRYLRCSTIIEPPLSYSAFKKLYPLTECHLECSAIMELRILMWLDSCQKLEGLIVAASSREVLFITREWNGSGEMLEEQWYGYTKNVFHYLEMGDLFDPLNDLHLFCSHHVFIPRINRALKEFVPQHKSHRLRTEHCYTPNNYCILCTFVVMWNPFTTHPPSIPLFMGWRKVDLLFGTWTMKMQ